MGSRILSLAVLAAMVVAGNAAAETKMLVTVEPLNKPHGYEKVSLSKAVVGSVAIRLWANANIDPDCSAHEPGPTLTVLEAPKHGQATVSDEPFFAAYPQANPRSACNTRKVPGHQAFYTATPGYTGRDKVVLQGSSPEGRVRRITVDIDVR